MNGAREQFRRFRDEYARLHDPTLLQASIELLPMELSELLGRTVKSIKKHRFNEQLLPTSLSRHFEAPALTPSSATEAPGSRPLIRIEPTSVKRRLNLFQEEIFACDVPGAKRVELVWIKQSPTEVETASTSRASHEMNSAQLDHRQGDRFEGQVGLPEGNYLMTFAVDGHTHPPPHLAQRIVINKQGVFAPFEIRHPREILVATNCGSTAERVLFETQEPWIKLDRTFIDLLGFEARKVSVEFETTAMRPGLNEGCLHFKVWREGETLSVGVIHFAIELIIGGAIGDFSFTPRELGEINQGLDDLQLRFEVRARGRGPLNGMISLPQLGEIVDFRLNADDESTSLFAHAFTVHSTHLPLPQPHSTEAALRVMILTDSFLANYRLCQTEIPYRLVYLKKSLPALSFGTVRLGSSKTLRLQVDRSDGQDIELHVNLPAGAESYLEAYPARANIYVFRFTTEFLPSDTKVDQTVELIDRKSGLRDQIKVLAAVAPGVGEPARALASLVAS